MTAEPDLLNMPVFIGSSHCNESNLLFVSHNKDDFILLRSPEWKKVSDSEKKELGLTFADNGEFW